MHLPFSDSLFQSKPKCVSVFVSAGDLRISATNNPKAGVSPDPASFILTKPFLLHFNHCRFKLTLVACTHLMPAKHAHTHSSSTAWTHLRLQMPLLIQRPADKVLVVNVFYYSCALIEIGRVYRYKMMKYTDTMETQLSMTPQAILAHFL